MKPVIFEIDLDRPKGSFPGRSEIGYYATDGKTLTLVDQEGAPIDPERFRHKLQPGDNPHQIAGRLLRSSLGSAARPFNRAINYEPTGWR